VDSRRFSTAAAHYAIGRPPYPPGFIADVAGALTLDRTHRLLDLGTGPGLLALAFAPYVGSVVAVDPEPEMLRLTAEAVRAANVAVEVREGSSETLGPEWGHFHAVTMGRSFHWMDRAATLQRLDLLVDPDGALALFNDELADAPENAALKAWSAVVERYSADDTVRMERRSAAWQQHEVVLAVSPFSRVERLVQVHRSTTTAERLIHRALSMSATSAARLGSRTEPMLEEIQAALAPFGGASGELPEVIEWTAIIAQRPEITARRG
jgi:ubiquinone/menaquinone biosynthesis C-methylase UbiE